MAASTVAVIAHDRAEAEAWAAAGRLEDYAAVVTADDVPAQLGGMANLRQDALEPELRDALTRALGVSPWPEP